MKFRSISNTRLLFNQTALNTKRYAFGNYPISSVRKNCFNNEFAFVVLTSYNLLLALADVLPVGPRIRNYLAPANEYNSFSLFSFIFAKDYLFGTTFYLHRHVCVPGQPECYLVAIKLNSCALGSNLLRFFIGSIDMSCIYLASFIYAGHKHLSCLHHHGSPRVISLFSSNNHCIFAYPDCCGLHYRSQGNFIISSRTDISIYTQYLF